ncbi:hypothetical protein L3Q82_021124 [Scortum barcoo]|uniref:Uncharacterized protein n=1 Tax=Scortum barcoo TaxID=214431 RepID=A0ACB8X379_9TELE|nr:hypothetical protein L3Q82_021124 [Scortum barcoo]
MDLPAGDEQVVKPVVSVYPAASRAHLEGKSSLLCVSSAMFPPLVQFSWKRQKEDGPLEELPPAEGEQLELRESGRTAAILLIRQPESSTYKYRCYVQHEGGTVEAPTEQELPAPAASCPPEREPADLPALQQADYRMKNNVLRTVCSQVSMVERRSCDSEDLEVLFVVHVSCSCEPAKSTCNKQRHTDLHLSVCFSTALVAMAAELIQEDLTLTRRVGQKVSFSCGRTDQCEWYDYVLWYQKKDTETFRVILDIDKTNGNIDKDRYNHPQKDDFSAVNTDKGWELEIQKVKLTHSATYYCSCWKKDLHSEK